MICANIHCVFVKAVTKKQGLKQEQQKYFVAVHRGKKTLQNALTMAKVIMI